MRQKQSRAFWDLLVGRYCIAMGILFVVIAILLVISWSKRAEGDEHCYPAEAHSTAIVYVPAGDNTAVKLRAWCRDDWSEWYVSFFTGDQPTLWEYAAIQNTASELLRGH